MIKVQKLTERKNDLVRVTFAMPAMDNCGCLYLVGWFEEWHESVYRMERADDGLWSLTLELEPGCEYLYCFRTDDGTWVYDPDMPRVLDRFGAKNKNSFVISPDVLSQ